jgi:teichuronic acid biosynthesis glycosyltransferase TuaC
MRILIITNMYPDESNQTFGIFIKEQVEAMKKVRPDWDFEIEVIEGYVNRWNYFKSIHKIYKKLKLKRYDIIHAHYGLSAFIAGIVNTHFKYPLIVTLHGSDVYIWWQKYVSKIAIKLADVVIFVSERMQKKLNIQNSLVIPTGVDISLFRPYDTFYAREKLGLPFDKKIIIFPADPKNKIKNYPLFFESVNLLPEYLKNKTLIIPLVGIKRHLVPLYFSAADVLVLTSIHEGHSMVIKEAVACNLPIISVDVGDVKTVIDGIEYCYIVDRKPKAIADKLSFILSLEHIRTNGRQYVEDKGFSGIQIAKKIINVYLKVYEERKRNINRHS